MDEKKFCFISCIDDKKCYEECLYYINDLNIPEGYKVEVLSIADCDNISDGYNASMNESDAKYKIYLHEDTFIINKNFLYDVLHIFQNDKSIGMIGVIGSNKVPIYKSWWQGSNNYGKIYSNLNENLQEVKFNDINEMYAEAKIIDGSIMITQYDIPWRNDINNGKYFYDISRCIEYSKMKYKIVIPKQQEPWVIHDCLSTYFNEYEKYHNDYLQEYGKEVLPLVSIIVKASNEIDKFKLLLESAVNQSYNNLQIIIYDDKSNKESSNIFGSYIKKYKNITYYDKTLCNDKNEFINIVQGEYIYFLDQGYNLKSNAIYEMMKYYIDDYNKDISIVSCNFNEMIDHICGEKTTVKDIISESLISGNYEVCSNVTYMLFNKDKFVNNGDFTVEDAIYSKNIQKEIYKTFIYDKIIMMPSTISNHIFTHKENTNIHKLDYYNLIAAVKEYGIINDDNKYLQAIDNIIKYQKDNNIDNNIEILNKLRNEVKGKMPLLSAIIDIRDCKVHLSQLISNVKHNIYSNVEFIVIKNEGYDVNLLESSSEVSLYDYSNVLTLNENIDRAMQNMKGQYFVFIDKYNEDYTYENLNAMMKYHEKNDLAVVLKGIKCDKDEEIEGSELLRYIAFNMVNLVFNKYIYIINRSYYINQIGTYFNGKFADNKDLTTICSTLRLGRALILSGNSKEILQTDNERISRYLGVLELVKLIKSEKYLNNITEYQKCLSNILEKVKNLIQKNNWPNLLSQVDEIKHIYEVDTKGFKFYDYGFNTVIREGAEIIRENAISIGSNTLIKEDSTLMVPYDNFEGSPRIIIGDNCDIGKRIFISAVNKVTIEDQVIMASNIHIADHNHEYKKVGIPIRLQEVDSYENEVKIGYGSWIGNNCVIVGNVHIGRGCTIGANSVVNCDIPDYCVAVGKPAKVIKYFDINEYKWRKVIDEVEYDNYLKSVKKPFLTIGIPTYNRSGFLDKCLNNIYSQVGNDELIEVVVRDNASYDATTNIIKKYQSLYNNIRYIKNEENVNIDINVNSIFDEASGRYMISCGDDDYYNETIIYSLINNLQNNNDVNVVFMLNESKELEFIKGNNIDSYIQMTSFNNTFISSIVLKKESYNKIEDKKKYVKYKLNQLYLQMEILKSNNNSFGIMSGNIFRYDSGKHKHISKEYNFAKVFMNNYLEILQRYLGNGLSEKVYKSEKLKLLNNMIIPWVNCICTGQDDLVIDNLFEYFKEHYYNEEYYNEKLIVLKNLMKKSVSD